MLTVAVMLMFCFISRKYGVVLAYDTVTETCGVPSVRQAGGFPDGARTARTRSAVRVVPAPTHLTILTTRRAGCARGADRGCLKPIPATLPATPSAMTATAVASLPTRTSCLSAIRT
jgi:hypothetical protein